MRWLPKTWNDILAVLIIVGVPLFCWLASVPDLVIGAMVSGWTLVVQFYFRRAPEQPPAGSGQ